MKIFMACDAESHYMCNAMVYLGKDTLEIPRGTTMGEVVVTELVAPFFVGGRTVTTDNFFSTLPLALSLASQGMHFCGTIRPKPYIPKGLYERRLKVKDSVAVFNYEHNLTLQCQQVSSTKKLMILSSCHHNPSVIEKNKTELQMFYNATKGGVDTFDQLCSLTSCIRKTRRWPLCLFFGMLNIAMVNAHILFSSMFTSTRSNRKSILKDAAFEFCTPFIKIRYEASSERMSRGLRLAMRGILSEGTVPSANNEAIGQFRLDKRRRCRQCPSSLDSKTNVGCNKCKNAVCIKHLVTYCSACFSEYKL